MVAFYKTITLYAWVLHCTVAVAADVWSPNQLRTSVLEPTPTPKCSPQRRPETDPRQPASGTSQSCSRRSGTDPSCSRQFGTEPPQVARVGLEPNPGKFRRKQHRVGRVWVTGSDPAALGSGRGLDAAETSGRPAGLHLAILAALQLAQYTPSDAFIVPVGKRKSIE